MEIRDKRGATGASIPNRMRFMKKAKEHIRRVVDEGLDGEKIITNPSGSREVSIPTDGIDEPFIRKSDQGGDRHRIFPGNEDFVAGDHIARPQGGGGQGSGDRAGHGDSADSFRFIISREEFEDLFFEDCALPNLSRQSAGDSELFSLHRAGFSKTGSPSQLDRVRTMRQSLGRRIALGRPKIEDIEALEEAIAEELAKNGETELVKVLREQLEQLKFRYALIPFIEPDHDVRYRRFERTPRPITRAVMFCLMDVSGSMSEEMKRIAKRFFYLLSRFLRGRYKHVDVVFIRHTDKAEEVDEETFFHSEESGGTAVSTGLEKLRNVIHERYSTEWNVYVAQASDGDNDAEDTPDVMKLMTEILPLLQYYAYIEVGEKQAPSGLWIAYKNIADERFAMQEVELPEDVVRVFYKLFRRTDAQRKEMV